MLMTRYGRPPQAGKAAGPNHGLWKGDDITYIGAHQRLYADRGRAADYVCPCGAPAREWAYDHADPNEKTEINHRGHELPYSIHPEHYVAMCKPCHGRLDKSLAMARH